MAVGDPGTRTAPAMTAAANDRIITLHLMDASTDTWAESIRVPVAATAANIEAFAAAYAAGSQASLYQISDNQIRAGVAQAANANTDQRNSVKQGVNLLWKYLATHSSLTPRLVAPILAALQGDLDIPIVGADPILAINLAFATLLTGGDFAGAQFTERRERKNNPRVGG